MKQRYPVIEEHAHSHQPTPVQATDVMPLMADSLEAMEAFYLEKQQQLEAALKQLNVLENAREITSLCKEINYTQTALARVKRKRKYGW